MAKKILTPQEKLDTNDFFHKSVVLNGYRPDAFKDINWAEQLDGVASGAITTATDIWVDGLFGNDANLGTQDSPYRTIRRATDGLIDEVILANVVVHVRRATYTENVIVGGRIPDQLITYTIQGEDTETPTGLTGAMTGTFTAFTNANAVQSSLVNMTGAGWAVNGLKGYFVKILSGASAGQIYPISSNTVENIEIPTTTSSALNGAQFSIVKLSVVIKSPVVGEPAVQILGAGHRFNQSHFLNNIWVDHSAVNAPCMYVAGVQAFRTNSCKFVTSGSNIAVSTTSAGVAFFPTNSWFEGADGFAFRALSCHSTTATACHFLVTIGGNGSCVVSTRCEQILINGVVEGGQIGVLTGSSNQEPTSHVLLNSCYVRSFVQQGAYTRGEGLHVIGGRINGGTLGILNELSSNQGAGRGGGHIHLTNATIDTCIIGISMNQPHGFITADGTTSINNCTQIGVLLGNGNPYNYGSHQSFAYVDVVTSGNPGLQMVGNAQDFSISPTNFVSLATVLAAPGQIVVDSNYFNRISVSLATATSLVRPTNVVRTTAVVDLWVDGTNGSDANPGIQLLPYKTINAAVAPFLGSTILHNVTIHVKTGLYTETIVWGGSVPDQSVQFMIQAEDLVPAALTGAMTGTFTSGTDANSVQSSLANLNGAGWNVNALKGYYVQMTSGTKNGTLYPIVSNTATSLEITTDTAAASGISGSSFRIVSHAVEFRSPVSGVPVIQFLGNGHRFNGLLGSHQIKNIFVDGSTQSASAMLIGGNGKLLTQGCKFRSTGNAAVRGSSRAVNFFPLNSWFESTDDRALYALQGAQWTPQGCYFLSTTGISAIIFNAMDGLTFIGCVIEAPGGTGITNGGGNSTIGTFEIVLFNSYLRGGGTGDGMTIRGVSVSMNGGRISNMGGNGIAMVANSVQGTGVPGIIYLLNATIDTCHDGIHIQQSGIHIYSDGNCSIMNNVAHGIILSSGNYAGQNSYSNMSSGVMTMTGNGQDFQFTAAPLVQHSWADLQAAPNKILVDALYFNRLTDAS